MLSVMEGWPTACREEKGAFSGRWKIFLREKEKLGLQSSGAGGWLLLQRLLEGQIRERKEIWAERLL